MCGTVLVGEVGGQRVDGLSGLFVVQVGHGRRELAEVAAKQAAKLAYFPVWGYTTPVQAGSPNESPTWHRAT